MYITEQYPKGLGATEPEISALLPKHSTSFEKTCFSCTSTENFMQLLSQKKHKQVILAGMEAHICVLQTAIQLLAADYQVFVLADAICSRHKKHYKTALQRMTQAGAIVCHTESILFEWLGDARHECFKELSGLLRKTG